jgi:hypothetical protein
MIQPQVATPRLAAKKRKRGKEQKGGESHERLRMMMTTTTEAHLVRRVTTDMPYNRSPKCNGRSSQRKRVPPELLPWFSSLETIHSKNPHGPVRQLRRDDGVTNQIESIRKLCFNNDESAILPMPLQIPTLRHSYGVALKSVR